MEREVIDTNTAYTAQLNSTVVWETEEEEIVLLMYIFWDATSLK